MKWGFNYRCVLFKAVTSFGAKHCYVATHDKKARSCFALVCHILIPTVKVIVVAAIVVMVVFSS